MAGRARVWPDITLWSDLFPYVQISGGILSLSKHGALTSLQEDAAGALTELSVKFICNALDYPEISPVRVTETTLEEHRIRARARGILGSRASKF